MDETVMAARTGSFCRSDHATIPTVPRANTTRNGFLRIRPIRSTIGVSAPIRSASDNGSMRSATRVSAPIAAPPRAGFTPATSRAEAAIGPFAGTPPGARTSPDPGWGWPSLPDGETMRTFSEPNGWSPCITSAPWVFAQTT